MTEPKVYRYALKSLAALRQDDENGGWVSHADYAKLQARVEELEISRQEGKLLYLDAVKENKRLREALEGYECTCEKEATEGWVGTVMTCPRCAALQEPTDD